MWYNIILKKENEEIVLTGTPLAELAKEMKNYFERVLSEYIYPGNFQIEIDENK